MPILARLAAYSSRSVQERETCGVQVDHAHGGLLGGHRVLVVQAGIEGFDVGLQCSIHSRVIAQHDLLQNLRRRTRREPTKHDHNAQPHHPQLHIKRRPPMTGPSLKRLIEYPVPHFAPARTQPLQ